MSRYHDVAALLIDIEAELRQLGHWQSDPPPDHALRSEQPFAVDTLEFYQWLQFIFIPKISFLVEQREWLPGECAIAPMAEEYYRGRRLPVAGLLQALEAVDELLSQD